MKNFLLVLFVSILCACGGDDDDGSGQAPGSENEGSTASEGGSGAEGEPASNVSPSATPNCGNGIVEADIGEECDDGNTDDTDGCTALCEFGCHSDSECQEDECAGAGSTCDLEFHYCTAGQGAKPDGEPCGMNGSCRSGACVEHECNNGYQEPGEECDDGDSDDTNGCTIDCKYGCSGGDMLTLPPLGEPDADTDGDGTNDSYTVVLRLSIRRLSLLPGWAEGAPLMQPAAVVD